MMAEFHTITAVGSPSTSNTERAGARLLALALLLGGCAAPLPQLPPAGMPANVTAPEIRVGDTWTYRVRDGYTGIERGDQSYRVTDAGTDRISVAVSGGGRLDETYIYNREWNWLSHPATNLQLFDYSPPYQAYSFPLSAGKTWHARLTATDPATGHRFPVWIDGTVLGWEKVKVPSGEFDALKVKRAVFVGYWELAVRGWSEILEYEWYAPAVRQVVRREASSQHLRWIAGRSYPGFLYAGRDDNGGGRFVLDDWLIYELVSYPAR